ncbi:hypothetical protein FOZ60_008141 [Perkinsus olseni]|uniref:Uncharacterized protein n=1 Tax=Perkinsus olseni TaxID=32597 RepID=A0A7J6NLA4_PEROL|nr:hypothetical protein FOZ60_008141 [Perkinsus olseni]
MALRLIIFVSFVAVLANGCGKGDTTNPTPCPTTMKPTPCPTTTIRSTSGYPVRYVNKHSGKFAYKRSQPAYARVAFLAPYDTSLGMFSVEYADGTSYQTGWFDLHPNKEDPASIHAVRNLALRGTPIMLACWDTSCMSQRPHHGERLRVLYS